MLNSGVSVAPVPEERLFLRVCTLTLEVVVLVVLEVKVVVCDGTGTLLWSETWVKSSKGCEAT